jgi:hypothetical protein
MLFRPLFKLPSVVVQCGHVGRQLPFWASYEPDGHGVHELLHGLGWQVIACCHGAAARHLSSCLTSLCTSLPRLGTTRGRCVSWAGAV